MVIKQTFRLAANRTLEGERRGAPERPPHFRPTVGSYGMVSKQAVKLNEKQAERGFQHYVFSPELVIDKGGHGS